MILEILHGLGLFLFWFFLLTCFCGILTYPFGSKNPDDRKTFNEVCRAGVIILNAAGWYFIIDLVIRVWRL